MTMRPITIAHPCQEAWEAMAPRAGGRYCARCDQTVVDLTTLAPAELDAFLVRLEAQRRDHPQRQVCLRIRRQQGAGAPAGCRPAARPARLHRRLTNGMAALLAMGLAGCAGGPSSPAGDAPDPPAGGRAQGAIIMGTPPPAPATALGAAPSP